MTSLLLRTISELSECPTSDSMTETVIPCCATPSEYENLSDQNYKAEVIEFQNENSKKILSAIHFATSQLYCQGRINFSNQAAKFHLELAASQGNLEAQIILGKVTSMLTQ